MRVGVPLELSAIISEMLNKNRDERPSTPLEVMKLLKPWFKPVDPPTSEEMPLHRFSHHRDIATMSKLSTMSSLQSGVTRALNASLHPCIFEYVYLARPDSVIDGISVYETRSLMGRSLADKIKREQPGIEIDVVIPIPDTSRPSALEVAQVLGVKYREGFIKNRYIGRTFIMPGQEQRRRSVRQKLNAMAIEFKGKNVLLVDDSIVRGTTSREIVQMARECGARKVYFASAAPPVRFPNVYGIDMPSRSELIATGRDTAQIAQVIGADAVFYQDLADLIEAVRSCNPAIKSFDASCFDGIYVTGGVSGEYLAGIEANRNDGESSAALGGSAEEGGKTHQLDLGLSTVDP